MNAYVQDLLTSARRRGPVAVVHQSLIPPEIDGVVKPPKPTGYRDSGADLLAALARVGVDIRTPATAPDLASDRGWTFPDDADGIRRAVDAGARTVWANTSLYATHPLEAWRGRVAIVGQPGELVERFEEKTYTLSVLDDLDVPVAPWAEVAAPTDGTDSPVSVDGVAFPAVVKPIRGRGSEGVSRVGSAAQLGRVLAALARETVTTKEGERLRFGRRYLVETYLPGDEITVAVMPPCRDVADGQAHPAPWALPIVRRVGHRDGIAPYSGDVPVKVNSTAMPDAEVDADEALTAARRTAVRVAQALRPSAMIRVDMRAGADGTYRVIDVNMKPNITGPGRPGRDHDESLPVLAAAECGWSYPVLIATMLANA